MTPLVVPGALLVPPFGLIQQSRLVEADGDVLQRLAAGFGLFDHKGLVTDTGRKSRVVPEPDFQVAIDAVEARVVVVNDNTNVVVTEIVDVALASWGRRRPSPNFGR